MNRFDTYRNIKKNEKKNPGCCEMQGLSEAALSEALKEVIKSLYRLYFS